MSWPTNPANIFSIVDEENAGEVEAKPEPSPKLSFPAFLRNPGLSEHLANIVQPEVQRGAFPAVNKNRRDEKEGKRWVRRKENARFVGNPHIVQASKTDYAVQPTTAKSTFPEPLPSYLPRTSQVPPSKLPSFEPNSASAGRFSLSLRGMRRDLKRAGFRAEQLIRDIEEEIMTWLSVSDAILAPDSQSANLPQTGRPIGDVGIEELSRSHSQLIWRVKDDAFARYVVHCCARYHEVVSFSKDLSGERLTYLLRPNVTLPDRRATQSLATPPTTDVDSSHFDSEADLSDRDRLSDIPSDSENELEASPLAERPVVQDSSPSPLTRSWLIVDDSDGAADGDESDDSDGLLSGSIDSLSIDPVDTTPRQNNLRSRVHNSDRERIRSTSSPSRSPVRMQIRRPRERIPQLFPRAGMAATTATTAERKHTLYAYIFL